MQEQYTSSLYISAAHKSSGKTIVTLGLCAALNERGLAVQPFKKGPDYIDPLWLTRAAQCDCMNLDFNTQSRDQIVSAFESSSAGKAILIVEGNKGLYDGVAVDGSDSNAELVALLSIPVVLVIDTQGTTRGIVPLLLGYQNIDRRINIIGVILNKIAGPRHEQKLVANVAAHTDISILGAIPRDKRLLIDERHLGLVPSTEVVSSESKIECIKNIIEASLDLDTILSKSCVKKRSFSKTLTSGADIIKPPQRLQVNMKAERARLRIGIPKDRVFGFYYPDDLRALQWSGCDLIFFNTLEHVRIPRVDGLFIGGGFPEIHMAELAANDSMLQSIDKFIDEDGPVYAECGGLMYLGQSIRWGKEKSKMVGALAVCAKMEGKPIGRGYMRLEETGCSPWGRIVDAKSEIHAHEFHYSKIKLLDESQKFAYKVTRGWGIDGKNDGLVHKNVLASYSHLRSINPVNWTSRFVQFVQATSNKQQKYRLVNIAPNNRYGKHDPQFFRQKRPIAGDAI